MQRVAWEGDLEEILVKLGRVAGGEWGSMNMKDCVGHLLCESDGKNNEIP